MFRALMTGLLSLTLVAGAPLGLGQRSEAGVLRSSSYMGVGNPTSVPYGWVDFCRRYHGECDEGAVEALDVNLTPRAQHELDRVNDWVNTSIDSVSDLDHWGVIDQWDYPTDGKGDCEDFVLLKRKMLIERGFPRQALLITVVKDENGEGHAVLTVKTNRGEFILDNLVSSIRPWNETNYRFVKRQSQTNQNVWVTIGEPTSAPTYVSR